MTPAPSLATRCISPPHTKDKDVILRVPLYMQRLVSFTFTWCVWLECRHQQRPLQTIPMGLTKSTVQSASVERPNLDQPIGSHESRKTSAHIGHPRKYTSVFRSLDNDLGKQRKTHHGPKLTESSLCTVARVPCETDNYTQRNGMPCTTSSLFIPRQISS